RKRRAGAGPAARRARLRLGARPDRAGGGLSALVDSLAAQFAATPAARREALGPGEAGAAAAAAPRAADVPGPRSERWKYTPLRALAQRRFGAAQGVALDAATRATVNAMQAPHLVFVNGRFDAALSALDGLPEGVELRPLSQALDGD